MIRFSELSRRELDRIIPRATEADPPTLADQALLAEAVTTALQQIPRK